MAKRKTTNNDLQNTTQLKIEQHEPHKTRGWTRVPHEGKQFLLH